MHLENRLKRKRNLFFLFNFPSLLSPSPLLAAQPGARPSQPRLLPPRSPAAQPPFSSGVAQPPARGRGALARPVRADSYVATVIQWGPPASRPPPQNCLSPPSTPPPRVHVLSSSFPARLARSRPGVEPPPTGTALAPAVSPSPSSSPAPPFFFLAPAWPSPSPRAALLPRRVALPDAPALPRCAQLAPGTAARGGPGVAYSRHAAPLCSTPPRAAAPVARRGAAWRAYPCLRHARLSAAP
jgi:hypothetical protein